MSFQSECLLEVLQQHDVCECINSLPEKPVRSMALRLVALMIVAVSLPAVGR